MRIVLIGLLSCLLPLGLLGQETNDKELATLIAKYKKDPRGPYKAIKWFCDDGSIQGAKEPCEEGGVQHAQYKDAVVRLGEENHIFLGQILASTEYEDFWDQEHNHSRMKQYMLEKYLQAVDNGWANQRAQFYRGAIQAEDEQEWGKKFFQWLLKDDVVLEKYFYLLRQSAKDIPHSGDNNEAQLMRSQSKALADSYQPFMDLRIKIHGHPEPVDIAKVQAFKKEHASKLSNSQEEKMDDLVKTMQDYFAPIAISGLLDYLEPLSNAQLKTDLQSKISRMDNANAKTKIELASENMWHIRQSLLKEPKASGRLSLLDLSLQLERLIMNTIDQYPETTVHQLMDKICHLGTAVAASGLVEIWEWERIGGNLSKVPSKNIALGDLETYLAAARSLLQWGTGMNMATFSPTIERYEGFEPMVHGFLDDRIRGSVMLYLGNSLGKLGKFVAKESGLTNAVLDLDNQSHIHGLNPGFAKGTLHIVSGNTHDLEVDSKGIYVFERPPSDLKPIAGILNVSEGNMVSHVQLLARNLGIPNATLSSSNVDQMRKYEGKEVFYAVTPKGTVLIKPSSEMNPTENALFSVKAQARDVITVDVNRIKLDVHRVLNLTEVDRTDSGITCGPKAANLGNLKGIFPEHVVDGFVIPFGIFYEHMKQKVPGESFSYWEYLTGMYSDAKKMASNGASEKEIEKFELGKLAQLRKWINEMPLSATFLSDLESSFQNILGKPIGEAPVFLRSDTNMEDLDSFTGAGLNLTLFNVKPKDDIIAGIKKVWASPYTERSFKWRQKYLENPENVFPSIVVIPGVNNDCSGVMITKGVSSGRTDQNTVAFSRGVGGAVDGQAAETWTLDPNGTFTLQAPSREPLYTVLPADGGSAKRATSFEKPILDNRELTEINKFSKVLEKRLSAKGFDGPYDMELGFKDYKLWLFQVRPFVESRSAQGTEYFEAITPKTNSKKSISIQTNL